MKEPSEAELVKFIRETYGMGMHSAKDALQRIARDAKVPTERTLIAAMAMQGLADRLLAEPIAKNNSEWIAAAAVGLADALLAELAKERKP